MVQFFEQNVYSSSVESNFRGRKANEDKVFIPRDNFSLSAILEKKEWCLTEQSEVGQQSNVKQSVWMEIKEREKFSFLKMGVTITSGGYLYWKEGNSAPDPGGVTCNNGRSIKRTTYKMRER